MFNNLNIVVGVTGGIAVYKVCGIVSYLTQNGANVDVIMTENATKFVNPLTLEILSQNKVTVDMFDRDFFYDIHHISLAQKADLFLVVPATANIIGKIANGIADDMLSTTIMATKANVVFAPAMNNNMYDNPIVQDNISKLKKHGYKFIDPVIGHLACGEKARGKLASNEEIIEYVKVLTKKVK